MKSKNLSSKDKETLERSSKRKPGDFWYDDFDRLWLIKGNYGMRLELYKCQIALVGKFCQIQIDKRDVYEMNYYRLTKLFMTNQQRKEDSNICWITLNN